MILRYRFWLAGRLMYECFVALLDATGHYERPHFSWDTMDVSGFQ